MRSLGFSFLICRSILDRTLLLEAPVSMTTLIRMSGSLLPRLATLAILNMLHMLHTARRSDSCFVFINLTTPVAWWRQRSARLWALIERIWARCLKNLQAPRPQARLQGCHCRCSTSLSSYFEVPKWPWSAVDSKLYTWLTPVPPWQSRHHVSGGHQAKQGCIYDDCHFGAWYVIYRPLRKKG